MLVLVCQNPEGASDEGNDDENDNDEGNDDDEGRWCRVRPNSRQHEMLAALRPSILSSVLVCQNLVCASEEGKENEKEKRMTMACCSSC